MSARPARSVVPSQRPTSAPPLPPRLPNLAESPEGVGPEETTAVVVTPAMAPRKISAPPPTPASGVRALTVSRPAPPLPARAGRVAAAVAKLDDGAVSEPLRSLVVPAGATAEMVSEPASQSEPDLVFKPVFPVAPLTRALQLVTAAALFVLFVSTAALRWAGHAAPILGARAIASTSALVVRGRARLRLEWLRAAAAATEPRLRRD